jgi:hypothetical protein
LAEHTLPPRLVQVLQRLHAHFKYLDEQIAEIEKELTRQLADDDLGQRLMTVPGIGPITASVLASEMGDGKQYRCAGISPPRWAWYPGSTVRVAGTTCWALASAATRICDVFSCRGTRLHATAGAPIRNTGALGKLDADSPALECRRLRAGQ